jgi:hypothetical protein
MAAKSRRRHRNRERRFDPICVSARLEPLGRQRLNSREEVEGVASRGPLFGYTDASLAGKLGLDTPVRDFRHVSSSFSGASCSPYSRGSRRRSLASPRLPSVEVRSRSVLSSFFVRPLPEEALDGVEPRRVRIDYPPFPIRRLRSWPPCGVVFPAGWESACDTEACALPDVFIPVLRG